MQQIASKVGITKASLYNHFSSRDEIVEEMYTVLRDMSKKKAAVGGVDVRIICPLHPEAFFTDWASRSYLRELHEAGAKIYLYQAGFLHAKTLVSDDALSTCGSTNLDIRSFENNFEVNAFVYDEGTALRMKKIFLDDLKQSVEMSELPRRTHPRFGARLLESLTRLVSPLL
jgi:cardiolipin synthase